jgi:hypothetical protein
MMFRLIAIFLVLFSIVSVVCPQSRNRSTGWLNGTWEGKGYQIDTDETWTMKLRVNGKRSVIEYPSLNCGGTWRRLSIGPTRARLREKITFGLDECTNKGNVVIERLSSRQIAFRYYKPGTRDVSASAILNKKR